MNPQVPHSKALAAAFETFFLNRSQSTFEALFDSSLRRIHTALQEAEWLRESAATSLNPALCCEPLAPH
jgi:meiotically up-regulated gene 157 (Mug157) protein